MVGAKHASGGKEHWSSIHDSEHLLSVGPASGCCLAGTRCPEMKPRETRADRTNWALESMNQNQVSTLTATEALILHLMVISLQCLTTRVVGGLVP